ncbi:MAG: CHASE3 domain-containing protein, partial [Verrucomicrobiales bacterium]|nr:CHASE3 domain-containing protein [Verrucomicrobiales bacterium]
MGLGFGLTLVVFVIVGAISYRSTTQLIVASDARTHTYDVLARLTEVLALLTDVQTGQRGYVITGDDAYLAPYQSGLGKLDETTREIRSLTVDSIRQQRRLETLEPLIKARLALSHEAIQIRRTNGLEAAVQFTKAGKGEAAMDEIRKVLDEMRSEEEELLSRRVEQAKNDAEGAKGAIVLGTLTALLLAALAGFAITRNIARPLLELTTVAEKITVGDLSFKSSA